ncbi:MAG: HD domain-containing protein [Candidatus Thorarchaeota archaeon]
MREKKNLDLSLMNFIDPSKASQDYFTNKEITRLVEIELNGFEFFFELIGLDDTTKKELSYILSDARRLPAALGGFHGDYPGGLFDHILLVVNYAYFICSTLKDKTWQKQVILTAICHDFGKIQYYGFKLDLNNRKIKIHINDAETVRLELTSKFKVSGEDRHVENGIAIIKRYLSKHTQLFDDSMYQAIAFHHGSWSRYQPQKLNELAYIIHIADMISSQIFKI